MTKNKTESARAEHDALNKEYIAYVDTLRSDWLAKNRFQSNEVYEVMRPEERAKVQQVIDQWGVYIVPRAEAWWKKRGYGVIWPEDDSKPMKVYKLPAPTVQGKSSL